jgi:hypothetical protein
MSNDKYPIINEMHSLVNLFWLTSSVHLGATINIVFSILISNHYFRNYSNSHFALLGVSNFFIAVNILPVVILRILDEKMKENVPPVNSMPFFRDQHRFSSWFYFVASANLQFWIFLSWFISFFNENDFQEIIFGDAIIRSL